MSREDALQSWNPQAADYRDKCKALREENARLEHEWQIKYDKLWDEAAGYKAEVKRLVKALEICRDIHGGPNAKTVLATLGEK